MPLAALDGKLELAPGFLTTPELLKVVLTVRVWPPISSVSALLARLRVLAVIPAEGAVNVALEPPPFKVRVS